MQQVSIIMATYNRAHYIAETLRSIIAQKFENWECLIIDDGSIDNTKEIVEDFSRRDKRIQYFKRPSNYEKGLPGSRNYGLDLAKGDYIIFFDDDDIVHPLNLQLTVSQLYKSNYSFCRYIRKSFEGNFDYKFDMSESFSFFEIGSKDIEKIIMGDLPINSCAILWNRKCFENNRFIEYLQYAEEWELYPRIISNGYIGISIEKCLFYGRKHPNSNTGQFFSGDEVRRKSKLQAIQLVAENLVRKKLLSYSLSRYLFNYYRQFGDLSVFNNLARSMQLTPLGKSYWYLFYNLLPMRYFISRKLKRFRD